MKEQEKSPYSVGRFGQPPLVRYHGKGLDAYGRTEWEAKEEFLKMTGRKPEDIKVRPGEAKDWPPLTFLKKV